MRCPRCRLEWHFYSCHVITGSGRAERECTAVSVECLNMDLLLLWCRLWVKRGAALILKGFVLTLSFLLSAFSWLTSVTLLHFLQIHRSKTPSSWLTALVLHICRLHKKLWNVLFLKFVWGKKNKTLISSYSFHLLCTSRVFCNLGLHYSLLNLFISLSWAHGFWYSSNYCAANALISLMFLM